MINWKFYLPALVILLVAGTALVVGSRRGSQAPLTTVFTPAASPTSSSTPAPTTAAAAVSNSVNAALEEAVNAVQPVESSDPALVSGQADSTTLSNFDQSTSPTSYDF